MRLKLVLIASLIAAIAGPGVSLGIIFAASASFNSLSKPDPLVLLTLVLPTATVTLATLFVYRHTARRRKLQAVLTAVLGVLLSLGVFTAAWLAVR